MCICVYIYTHVATYKHLGSIRSSCSTSVRGGVSTKDATDNDHVASSAAA